MTPTLQELFNSVLTDLRSKLQVTTLIGKIGLNAFAAVQAAKLKIQYLTINNVDQNIFVDTADDETIIRYGLVKLGRLPLPATAGEYSVEVTGSIGAEIPPGTTFVSVDPSSTPGVILQLDTLFTFAAETGTILLRSLELGPDFSLQAGDNLQVTAPLANVDSFSTVLSVQTTPTAAEDIEEYRQTVIEAYRSEPQGGARVDYRVWTSDVAGLRTVYPYVKNGDSGVIDLFSEATAIDSTDGNGTPPAAILQDVQDSIEPDKRPMGTFQINYLPIITNPVDVEIENLSDPSFLPSIEEAIRTFLLDVRPFIDGADDINNRNDRLYESDIYGIVRDVIGSSATFDSLEMFVNSVSEDIFLFDLGNTPYINSVATV